jgi:hypothetical protein
MCDNFNEANFAGKFTLKSLKIKYLNISFLLIAEKGFIQGILLKKKCQCILTSPLTLELTSQILINPCQIFSVNF